jgi:drug/metabolite transporter (DMT)-like permease
MGILYSIIVLLGNTFLPIINNTRPTNFDALFFAWMIVVWEVICILPIYIRESLLKTHNQEKPINSIKPPVPIKLSSNWRWMVRLFIIGLLFSVATIGQVYGLSEAGSISGSIALKTAPIYSMMYGSLFLGEKITIIQILITIILFLGLVYMGTKGTFQLDQFSWGVGVLMIVPFFWAIGHGLTKPLLEKKVISSAQIILIRNAICSILIGILYLSIAGTRDFWQLLSPIHVLYMFLIGFNSMVMHYAWYKSISIIDISVASALAIPSPVLTTFLALLITHEALELFHIIGLSVSLLGLYLLILVQRKKERIIQSNNQQSLLQN